jgi:hypothetical protein
MLKNTLGTYVTCWEYLGPIWNLIGALWELDENTLGTKKKSNSLTPFCPVKFLPSCNKAPHKMKLSQINPQKPYTHLWFWGSCKKFRWLGHHFLKRKQNFQNYLKYIFFGYLLEPCIEIWWFWTIYNFFKIWRLFSAKNHWICNNNNNNNNVKLLNLAPGRKGEKKWLKLKI